MCRSFGGQDREPLHYFRHGLNFNPSRVRENVCGSRYAVQRMDLSAECASYFHLGVHRYALLIAVSLFALI